VCVARAPATIYAPHVVAVEDEELTAHYVALELTVGAIPWQLRQWWWQTYLGYAPYGLARPPNFNAQSRRRRLVRTLRVALL